MGLWLFCDSLDTWTLPCYMMNIVFHLLFLACVCLLIQLFFALWSLVHVHLETALRSDTVSFLIPSTLEPTHRGASDQLSNPSTVETRHSGVARLTEMTGSTIGFSSQPVASWRLQRV